MPASSGVVWECSAIKQARSSIRSAKSALAACKTLGKALRRAEIAERSDAAKPSYVLAISLTPSLRLAAAHATAATAWGLPPTPSKTP